MYICKNDNMIGCKFGRLTVIERVSKNGRGYYKCKCECGNEITTRADQLKNGRTKSCGCYNSDKAKSGDARRTHGQHGTRLYRIWQGMHGRCYIISHPAYKYYGERGISICDDWKNDFQSFYDWALSNGYSDSLTIDRINVNGNYEPLNCRWVTRKRQMNNTRNNHFINYNGEIHTIAEWSTITGISATKISWRLAHKWKIEKALTTM